MQEWPDWIPPSSTFDVIKPIPVGYELQVVDHYGAKVRAMDPAGVKPRVCFDFRLRRVDPPPESLWQAIESGEVHPRPRQSPTICFQAHRGKQSSVLGAILIAGKGSGYPNKPLSRQ